MKVRHECHFEIARFDCRDFSFEGRGLSAPHNARSEIHEVSTIINNDGRWLDRNDQDQVQVCPYRAERPSFVLNVPSLLRPRLFRAFPTSE